VYDADPEKVKGAKRYDKLSFDEAIRKNLKVMDQTAFSLCRESKLKILVFDMHKKDSILQAAKGKKVGTLIS
jgi:uridylate kinase